MELVKQSKGLSAGTSGLPLPSLVIAAGERASRRFVEFFTANIRNPNTRRAYARAVADFCQWCEARELKLEQLEPVIVAAYIEQHPGSPPTVKQHLAAIRMLFDWLVVGQIIPMNPAASVRGPRHVVKRGKTPVLTSTQARALLDSIDTSHVVGLRDRALIGTMVYSFARVGAVVGMKVDDYYQNGKRWWLRLHEKGGKFHEVPAHHTLETYIDAYIEAAGIAQDRKGPLFRSAKGKTRLLTKHPMTRTDVLRMIKRRAADAGLPRRISCHTFRATGITAFLENGGTLEAAQAIAAHESARTTKLYDRTGDAITLDDIERIAI
ncbi:MAG TPA: tyrosine-type recombinase/integrase [Candidatus Hydrogenedentes bacterium]|nr:tyrosine-type recombinase/integrase [Candidatus Hydrogenedentota bacterium]